MQEPLPSLPSDAFASPVSSGCRGGIKAINLCWSGVKPPPTRAELSERYRIGNPGDTPASLRRKAADFLKIAESAADIDIYQELHLLSTLYQERAAELEKTNPVAVIVTEPKTTS